MEAVIRVRPPLTFTAITLPAATIIMPEDTATQSVYESREELVYKAIEGNDFSKLREISALPGGFKGARRRAW